MTKARTDLSWEEADAAFYCRDGLLYRKVATVNCRPLDEPVGTLRPSGYAEVSYRGELWKVHRIVFLLAYGFMPPEVDHANGNTRDNRPENLRAATRSQNTMNARKRRDNTSGVKGVTWSAQKGKWKARIQVNGKRLHAGFSDDPQELALRLDAMRANLHGDFANPGG